MQGFTQYFTELANPRKSLWIFDFDDTLAVDTARVDVIDKETGKVIKRLSSEEFREYKLKDNEKFDFHGASKKEVRGNPIPATLKILRSVMGRGGRTVVLTGRNYGETAKKYLEKMGIDIEVIAIGGKSGSTHEGVARAKADWIQSQIDQGYNDIEFHDDNKLNLEYAKKLAKPGEVRIRTKLIRYSPKG
jgi:hydroxymethylpyrimidine pyrophosphatase-like HAD family hydrolase